MVITGGTIVGIIIGILGVLLLLAITIEIIIHVGGRRERRNEEMRNSKTNFNEEIKI